MTTHDEHLPRDEHLPGDEDLPRDDDLPRDQAGGGFGSLFRQAWDNRQLRWGVLLSLLLLALAVLAPLLTPYGPGQINPTRSLQPPSLAHPFGTNQLGVDVFSRTLHAGRVDLFVAFAATALAALLGVPLGLVLGYVGGRWDNVVMRVLEAVQSFPPIVLAMAVLAAFGQSLVLIVAVIAFIGFPYYVRLVRSEAITKRNWDFIEAAESIGLGRGRIMVRHLLPNSVGPAIVYASLNGGYAILVAATLGFLGLGIPPGSAEWGLMVREGSRGVISGEWWLSFFPGMFITLAVGAFYLVGDGLRDVLDPREEVLRP